MSKHLIVDLAFEGMTEGERCHMANKLYKEGYLAVKARKAIAELVEESRILDGACDFWKETAIELGYKEQ